MLEKTSYKNTTRLSNVRTTMMLPVIMGTVGGAIGIIVGILIFSSVAANIECPNVSLDAKGNSACNTAKNTAWTVLGILPIGL